MAGLLAALAACSRPPQPAAPGDGQAGAVAPAALDAATIAEHNRAVGLMGQFQYAAAEEVFARLSRDRASWLDVRVNQAIATLNRQLEGDEARALELLADVLAADANHQRARYCSGLLRLYLGETEAAFDHFLAVAGADPADPFAAYYVGQCLEQRGQLAESQAWYRRALEHDPYLRSAYWRLSQTATRLGQADDAAAMLGAFERLKTNPRSHLVEFIYTKMGPKGEAMAIDSAAPSPAAPRPEGPLFADPRPLLEETDRFTWNPEPRERPLSITLCDLTGDGRPDVFLADALREPGGARNAVCLRDSQGRFTLALEHPLAAIADVNAALWGDFDNDQLTDVYLCRNGPNQLWRQTAPGQWEDVTDSAGAADGPLNTIDGAMFDADHDADLDILCINSNGPNELLSNNLDGTFRTIGSITGLADDPRGSRQALVSDLDDDRDVDIIILRDEPPHEVFENHLGWEYRAATGFDHFQGAAIAAAVAVDLDADGSTELFSISQEGDRTIWRRNDQRQWMPTAWPEGEHAPALPRQVAAGDISGDGAPLLLDFSSGAWRAAIGSPEGLPAGIAGGHADATSWALAMLDPAAGPSLISASLGRQPFIWPPGPGRHRFASIAFSGKQEGGELDPGQTMRSNASGIGVRAAARVDSRWACFETFRAGSGPGQSLQPWAVGLGGSDFIDFISLDWPDGVLQTEVHGIAPLKDRPARDFAPGSHTLIEQIQRQTSSCPVLFAWNGGEFAFVSDLLGVGGIGFLTAPGEYAPSRPWENFLLPHGLLQPRNGRYTLKIGEPMQEACYLDGAALVAYDLPPGWKMAIDERMGILDPQPTGEPRFHRSERLPDRAWNDRGEDVTSAIAAADLVAAPVGPLDRRFIGRLAGEHVLTLEFDSPLVRSSLAEPMLIADGWIEYPYAQTMFGAWQAAAAYVAPSIDARDGEGRWRTILEQFGYPAGMPRQMSVPLAGLPALVTAIRLRTNQEVYWDRLAVAWSEPCPNAVITRLPLVEADLTRSGFALRTTGPQRQPRYNQSGRSPTWDTRHQSGHYSALGEVTELVTRADGGMAIFGPGEEVTLSFAMPPTAPPLEPGWTRRFVLEAHGWCKDMDLYTRDGETIDPLPVSPLATEAGSLLNRRYNTRYESGR